MDQVPLTAPAPDAPICETGQTLNNIFFDNLENLANKKWASAPVTGAINRWSYPQDTATNPLGAPYATSGVNNIWGDDRLTTAANYAIVMTQSVTLPTNAYLHFDQAYDFKREGTSKLNGGVVEYSTNNGATWNDAGALFTTNGYNATIATGHGNPLAGKRGFGGLSNGYLSSRLKLSSLAGQNVRSDSASAPRTARTPESPSLSTAAGSSTTSASIPAVERRPTRRQASTHLARSPSPAAARRSPAMSPRSPMGKTQPALSAWWHRACPQDDRDDDQRRRPDRRDGERALRDPARHLLYQADGQR